MGQRAHRYAAAVRWTGNTGAGTASYRAYERAFAVTVEGKPALLGSSDPLFRGDAARYNPEELLVASVSSCHLLWYLHLCATNGVVVLDYVDEAEGQMVETDDGGGRFTRIVLRPRIVVSAESDLARAQALHRDAHAKCFIANSVNFPVDHEPTIVQASSRPRTSPESANA
ncbi:MAG TPA: OsmC family protein [Candidatus Sulfotelmatobacter sp.]|nr:OsmC family protein [Candidatus Sulfotelmatobacter sp.]